MNIEQKLRQRRSEIVIKCHSVKTTKPQLIEAGRIDALLAGIELEAGDVKAAAISLISAASMISRAAGNPITVIKSKKE